MPEISWMKIADLRHQLINERQVVTVMIDQCGNHGDCKHKEDFIRLLKNMDNQLKVTIDLLYDIIGNIKDNGGGDE